MTVITSAPATVSTGLRWLTGMRRAVATASTQVATKAAAARSRYRRPALTIGGLGSIAAAGYQVNLGVGLLITGAMCLLFEWLGSDE
jgi:hypothetical protein